MGIKIMLLGIAVILAGIALSISIFCFCWWRGLLITIAGMFVRAKTQPRYNSRRFDK